MALNRLSMRLCSRVLRANAASLAVAQPCAATAGARPFSVAKDTAGYQSTIEFESPDGHEFEQVVDVGLSDVSYAAFVNRGTVAR